MNIFIKKIIIIAGIVFAIVFLLNYTYVNINVVDVLGTNKIKNIPPVIEVCNLGSSHGLYGFEYSDFTDDYSTFNFPL